MKRILIFLLLLSAARVTASGSPTVLEFEVGAGVQKVYTDAALRIYSIEFHTDKR